MLRSRFQRDSDSCQLLPFLASSGWIGHTLETALDLIPPASRASLRVSNEMVPPSGSAELHSLSYNGGTSVEATRTPSSAL